MSRAQELFGKLTKTARIDDPGVVLDIKREALRLKKLRAIGTSLKRSKNVQNRMLKTWLTKEEYREFEEEWRSQREIRSGLTEKPECLDRYEALLKKAIFFSNRAEVSEREEAPQLRSDWPLSRYSIASAQSNAYKSSTKRTLLSKLGLTVR